MKKDMSRKETIIVLESMMMTAGTCRTEKEALERAIKDIKKVKKMKKEKEKLASVTGLMKAFLIIDDVMKGEDENEG